MVVAIIILSCVLAIALHEWITTIISKHRKSKTEISFKAALDLVELPVVTFNYGDRKLNFLLDTGSDVSYLNASAADTISVADITAEGTTIGASGEAMKTVYCTIKLKYKDVEFEEEVGIANFDNAFDQVKQSSGVQIHGILGSRFFAKYKYILDFKSLTAYQG